MEEKNYIHKVRLKISKINYFVTKVYFDYDIANHRINRFFEINNRDIVRNEDFCEYFEIL